MSEKLQILLVEDNPIDAELILLELRRAGLELVARRVDTEKDFLAHLHPSLDLILSDNVMPAFSGSRALKLLQQSGLDVPFIIVSGSMGEDSAVVAMKEGADDYLIKDRLARLGTAAGQVIEKSRLRRENKRTEGELQSVHEQLRYLLANSPAVIYLLQIDGESVIPIFVTANIERLLGVTVAESTRYEWWLESLHPDDRERVLEIFAASLSGEGYSTEYRIRHKNGSYHWIEDKNRVVRDESGRATEAIGIWTDITERKETEARLIEQASIINRARNAIVVRNYDDDRITIWNEGAERLYGWSAREAIGQSMGHLVFASEPDRAGALQTLLATGEFHGDLKQVTKDRRELIVDGRSTLVRDPDGTPRAVLSINTDITEQKELETHLLRAQRLESIGTLASGVAHDLNNVLAPILMCAEMLRDQTAKRDPVKLISMIEECARRGAGIVRQVLTFARGVEGERVLINPSHLIQELTDIAQRTFPKTILITGDYQEDLWSMNADPTQLHQVLLNLAINARDAMPNGGSLAIAAENVDVDEQFASMKAGARPGPHILLRVSDTGSGMTREVLDKMFDPFFTTKDLGKGTGLGLSTVLGIVRNHGGFMLVDSEVGRGTAFKIFLPAEMGTGLVRPAAVPLNSLNGAGELIMVVDDDQSVLHITRMILEKHGYRVLTASDGTEALATMAQETRPVNAVLTDIAMPYMDGVVLLRAIKKMQLCECCIASTGQEETRLAELQELGVSNFLTKPYDSHALLTEVRATLSRA